MRQDEIHAANAAAQERRPFESGRTLWADVVARGYDMAALVAALTDGAHAQTPGAVEEVWRQTWRWGAPAAYAGGAT